MTNDFDQLPEQPVEIKGLPKTATDDLPTYYQTLGDGRSQLIGIETGISAIDTATMGLSGLIVLAGTAGLGKTTLALQVAYEACAKGTPVIFYSLEMPKRAIYTKILSRLAHIGYSDILLKGRPYLDLQYQDTTSGKVDIKTLFTKDEAEALTKAEENLTAISNRLFIRSREQGESVINFGTVEKEINLVKAELKADKVLVVIDHLQVFDYRLTERELVSDQIDKENKLIDRFKGLSERTDTPILLISQKNKEGFGKSGLETVKGSVDIIYLADIVMTLEGSTNAKDTPTNNGSQIVELCISKNRYNAPRTLSFIFDGRYSSFIPSLS